MKPALLPKESVVKFVDAPKDHGLQNVGSYILAVLIFVIYSRVLDVNNAIASLRLPLLMSIAVLAIAFMTGSVVDRIGIPGLYLFGFTMWVLIGSPFGFYRAQSLLTVIEMVKSFLIFTACAALIATVRQSRRLMLAVALSSLASALMSGFFGEMKYGRLSITQGGLGDPNAYAMFLLLGLPMWWYLARRTSRYAVKLICWGCTIPIFTAIAKTGSRGGMVALAALLLMVFFHASIMKKVQIMIVGVIFLGVLYVTLPPYLKARYFTLFAAETAAQLGVDEAKLESDVGSSEERYKLLINSLLITMRNPIFGVGAGNFVHYAEAEARKRGSRTGGQPTHNTYTEISSEAGLPALILFSGAIVFTFRRMSLFLKTKLPAASKDLPDMAHAVRYLRMSLVSSLVCCFFLSYAYKGIFQPLLGIITGVITVAFGELMRAKAAAESAAKDTLAASGPGPAVGPGNRPGPGGVRPKSQPPFRGNVPALGKL